MEVGRSLYKVDFSCIQSFLLIARMFLRRPSYLARFTADFLKIRRYSSIVRLFHCSFVSLNNSSVGCSCGSVVGEANLLHGQDRMHLSQPYM